MVAILRPGRVAGPLDLRVLHLLLHPRAAHPWIRERDAVFRVQLPGVCGAGAVDGDDWVSDGVCVCAQDIWGYQGGLKLVAKDKESEQGRRHPTASYACRASVRGGKVAVEALAGGKQQLHRLCAIVGCMACPAEQSTTKVQLQRERQAASRSAGHIEHISLRRIIKQA